MEQLRSHDGAVRGPGCQQDLLERARLYFERKAGRPVSNAEAREWLDALVEYLRTAQRWADEAAAHRASTAPHPDDQQDTQGSNRNTQGLPVNPAPRRIAAAGKPRASGRHATRDTASVTIGVRGRSSGVTNGMLPMSPEVSPGIHGRPGGRPGGICGPDEALTGQE